MAEDNSVARSRPCLLGHFDLCCPAVGPAFATVSQPRPAAHNITTTTRGGYCR
ncbi:hypothetical protein BZL29_6215 [Mycobacterium kansasii]|uniref:Uncharacterized protein n=1 Tax=Mycobacterium kansasii TaxID=1768 RepID=A0A1V3WRW3_MYCKA|nr:hypothetical protein BZL29_6215 [Mycobacterium kansasii]